MMKLIAYQKAFTLIEILIALSIFATMSMMAYVGLAAILNVRESTVPKAEQLAQLQTTLYLLNEDLNQAINRQIRDEFGTPEHAFGIGQGNEVLVLTRTVPNWSNEANDTQLIRVSYRLEEGVLYRRVWSTLDRTQQTEFRTKKLINTLAVTLKVFNVSNQLWEPYLGGSVPSALDITLKVKDLGDIHRVFFIH